MPLSVKDGMGAWVKDFQDSNAPQFKGKSDKERREMAIAAYLSAKRGGKPQDEATDLPFEPDPKKKAGTVKDKSGAKHTPMSRARDLARRARDAQKNENVSAPQTAAHRRAMMVGVNRDKKKAKRTVTIDKPDRLVSLKVRESVELDELSKATHDRYQDAAFKDAAKGMAKKRMGAMSSKDAYDNEKKRYAGIDRSKYLSRKMKEENLDELKKSTLGSYIKKASQDAGAKAYSAAQKAMSNPDQSGKDYVKSVKRQKGIAKATDKLAKEAKSFDQKFKDHLKFATSKSPAVQAYMKKRKADRDAAHAKQDPAAVKKNYGPAVIPPGTAYNKASKRGMNPSQAASAVSTAFKNRAKGGKLPK